MSIDDIREEIDPECEFDFQAALYWFCADHHEGQASWKYEILSQSPYNPSPLANGVSFEGEGAVDIYNKLVENYQ